MKKMSKLLLGVASLSLLLAGCSSQSASKAANKEEKKEDKVITVASALDSTEKILKIAEKEAEKEGYKIKMVRVNDNVQYNKLLQEKEVDANFSQHGPFMEAYNKANKANLVVVQKVYDAKVGFYSKDYKTIEELPDGGKVAIPNDKSNQGRALAILDEKGLIKLKDGVGYNGTVKDVIENPKNFEFVELDLLNLASAYDEKGMVLVYNYPTYLTKIGLTPADAIFLEKPSEQPFAISVVAREDNKDSKKIKVLKKAVASEPVREYFEKEEKVSLIPSF
ncbi:MetQ/NlpA family ABC transporter substrate-binding protein [Vagococcus sp.]|uniref:MetQ/NlpA family ABC transporter substrate-binding protein n=1 Tax=Vagococcus sp. TaxID=1933889 RepID=UPI003F9E5C69